MKSHNKVADVNSLANCAGSDLCKRKETTVNDFTEILRQIGAIGKWQLLAYAAVFVGYFWMGMINLAMAFFQITPDFACAVPALAASNFTIDQLMNLSSPLKADGKFDVCRQYEFPYDTLKNLSSFSAAYEFMHGHRLNKTTQCSSWVYDKSVMRSTIVTEWNLVCENRWGTGHAQLAYFFGYFVGAFLSGFVSDRFGRKPTYILSMLGMAAIGVGGGVAPLWWHFLVLRFFFALTRTFAITSSYTLVLEITDSRARSWVGSLFFLPANLGFLFLAPLAFYAREWRFMQLFMSVACFVALTFWWSATGASQRAVSSSRNRLVPESPRWLLVKRNWRPAEKIIRKAARLNGTDIPPQWDFEQIAAAISHEAHQGDAKRVSFFRIFNFPVLTMRALILAFCWLTLALVYYGSVFNVTFFAGNKFINNGVSAATELPLNFISIPMLYWGRKRSLCLAFFLAAAAFLAVPLIENVSSDVLKLALAIFGKGMIKMAFAFVYALTAEIYPTVMRNSGLSMSSCAGRVGAMSSQYIADISSLGEGFVHYVPMLIFGALSLAAGFLSLFLPETVGRKLPDHIEDAVNFTKQPRKGNSVEAQ